jgi:hypothetical protein
MMTSQANFIFALNFYILFKTSSELPGGGAELLSWWCELHAA